MDKVELMCWTWAHCSTQNKLDLTHSYILALRYFKKWAKWVYLLVWDVPAPSSIILTSITFRVYAHLKQHCAWFGDINDNSPCHRDLQQCLGVLVGLRDLEDPKKTKLKSADLASSLESDNSGVQLCSGANLIFFLTIYSQLGRKVLVVLQSTCPLKTNTLF